MASGIGANLKLENMQELHTKLTKLKTELTAISKDSNNPFFKSKYFDVNALLEHVEPLIQKNGLLLLQPIIDNVVTTQIIDPETGQTISSGIELTGTPDPQKRGSEVTYYRRYTLASLLGLQAEDDDANKSSGNTPQEKPEKPWLNVGSKEWDGAVAKKSSLEDLRKYFRISKANAEQYEQAIF